MSPPHERDCVKRVHDGMVSRHDDAAQRYRGHHRGPGGTLPPMDGPGSETETEPTEPTAPSQPDPARPARRPATGWLIGGGIAIIALLAMQVVLLITLDDTTGELEATRLEVADLEARIAVVDASVDSLADDIEGLADSVATAPQAAAPEASAPSSEGTSGLSTGFLPPFEQGQADRALGMRLGPLEGPDAYTGETLSIDPGDGTKRIWMIWAHWCPYCQQELPGIADVYPSLAADYPDIELLTVTSSIDPSRGNPLESYLESEQFPFPVLVDDDLELAGRMGVTAYPFWLVTDGDGTVLLRTTGLLEQARLLDLVTSLDSYGS